MENNPAGLYKTDTLKDCFKRADELSSPDGSRHTGMMCDRKDLRRIVLLVKTVRDLQMKLHGVVADAKQSESNFAIPVVIESEAAVCVKAKHQIHAINGIYTFCPDCGTKI